MRRLYSSTLRWGHMFRQLLPLGAAFALWALLQPVHAQTLNGYAFQAQASTYAALSGATRVAALETDEALVDGIPLGFSFAANGRYYTQISVSSNGWLAFGVGNGFGAEPESFPYVHTVASWMAAPLWANLSGQGAAASYQTTGTAPNRVFTFEWRDWRWDRLATQPVLSFQARLYEGSNRVEFTYESGSAPVSGAAPDARAVIGVLMFGASGLPTNVYVVLSNTGPTPALNASPQLAILSKPATGQQYRFTPTPNTLPPCPAPQSPYLLALRRTSARVGWDNTSYGGSYRIHYGPRGFVLGSSADLVVQGSPTDTAQIGPLLPNREYEMLTELVCGPNVSPVRSPRQLFTSLPTSSNDEGSGAIWLPVLTSLNSASLLPGAALYATPSRTTPLAACGMAPALPADAPRDVWYAFRATGSSHAIRLAATTTTMVMELRTSVGPSAGVVGCWRTGLPGQSDTTRVSGLTPGQAYFIRLYPTTANGRGVQAGDAFRVGVSGALPVAPPNDVCAAAAPLVVQTNPGTLTAGTLAAATSVRSAPNATGSCANSAGPSRDVWYQFVSPGSTVTVRFEADFEAVVELLTTCTGVNGLPQCISAQPTRPSSFTLMGLTAGTTYLLRVYRHLEFSEDDNPIFRLGLSIPVSVPPNDDCAQALPLPLTSRGQVGATGTLEGSTSSGLTGAPGCTWLGPPTPGSPAPPAAPQDVWYRFTASAPQQVLTLSSGTDAVLEVLGAGAGGLAPCAAGAGAPVRLGCTFANGRDWAVPEQRLPGRVLLSNLVVGQSYWARVYGATVNTAGYWEGPPDFTLSLHNWTAPANDEPAQAQLLVMSATPEPCTASAEFTLDGATPTFAPTGTNRPERDVWFSFVAPAAVAPFTTSGVAVRFNFSEPLVQGSLELRASASPTASVLTGFSGSVGARLGGYYGLAYNYLIPGATYYVRCTTSLSTPEPSSRFTLCLTPLVSNDEPCGALPLPLAPLTGQCQGTVRGTTYSASNSRTNLGLLLPVNNCGGDEYMHDVWYRVVPTGAAFTVRCEDLSLDLARLYEAVTAADCAGELHLVSCQASVVRVTVGTLPLGTMMFDNLTSGQPYYLAVSRRFGSPSPNFEFSLCAQQAMPLPTVRPVAGASVQGQLWPNPVPAGQVVNVQLPTTGYSATTPVRAQWLNIMGQLVPGAGGPTLISPSADGTLSVPTRGCIPGFYLLRCCSPDGQPLFTSRVVVE